MFLRNVGSDLAGNVLSEKARPCFICKRGRQPYWRWWRSSLPRKRLLLASSASPRGMLVRVCQPAASRAHRARIQHSNNASILGGKNLLTRGQWDMNRRTFHAIPVLFLFLFLLAASIPIQAQTITATLEGRVLDPSGAVLPRATVTAVNAGTGVSR